MTTNISNYLSIHEVIPCEPGKLQILKNMAHRYVQLSDIRQLKNIPNIERLRLAYIIESELPKVCDDSLSILKKLQWNIHSPILMGKENVYIQKMGYLGEGVAKKVTSLICLPTTSHDAHSLAAQTVTKRSYKDYSLNKKIREMEIHESLSGLPGIWPLRFWYCYQSSSNHCSEKIASVMDIADGNLLELLSDDILPLEKQLKIAKDLITGLHSMHSNNVINGDIKLENILYMETDEGIILGFTDFGHGFTIGEFPTFVYEQGFYGSIVPTAPELFGNREFVKNSDSDYFATDIWALGCTLYNIHFPAEPEWYSFLSPFYDEKTKLFYRVSPDDEKELETLINDSIEIPFKNLSEKTDLTKDEQFELIIYKMLRLNPKDRIDVFGLLKEINM